MCWCWLLVALVSMTACCTRHRSLLIVMPPRLGGRVSLPAVWGMLFTPCLVRLGRLLLCNLLPQLSCPTRTQICVAILRRTK
nr:MAG TPA: hypothetical protein [Caudoviricetes sp.]